MSVLNCYNAHPITIHLRPCCGTTSGDPASGADLSVAAGEVITGIDVQLSRYARVTGTVTGNDGQPLQNVVIGSFHIVTDTNGTPYIDSPGV